METLDNMNEDKTLEMAVSKAAVNFAKHKTHDGETIPDWIFSNLPQLLKESCNIFNDNIERDIFLTGTLSVLGGAFHNLFAYNEPDKKKVAPK